MNVSDTVINVENVKKTFRIYHEKRNTVFETIAGTFSNKKHFEELTVLDDVTFSIGKGEMVGIIGLNGSGKTTLLRMIAGIYNPNKGKIITRGTTIPLLELGSGFQPDLTAKENIILYGLILGFTKKGIESKVNDIIKFAELENFADTKIKNFSSGMYARLAFSTAIQTDPDILLIDEVLSVGDLPFQKKSFETFLSFKRRGKSIVFVSHDLETVKQLCDRVIFIHKGKIHAIGEPDIVINTYRRTVDSSDTIEKLKSRISNFKDLEGIDVDIFNLRPWADDFSKFGINTGLDELSIPPAKNQKFREPVITSFLEKVFKDIEKPSPTLLDMYCNNAYYSYYVMKNFKHGKIIAMDNDILRVEGAKLIGRKLNLTDIEIKLQDALALDSNQKFDIVLNLDALHNVSDPEKLISLTYKITKNYAIIATVISLENIDDDYFEVPSPGWSWGCRFSEGKIKKWIEKLDWKVIDYKKNILEYNHALRDRGEVYYLCKKNIDV